MVAEDVKWCEVRVEGGAGRVTARGLAVWPATDIWAAPRQLFSADLDINCNHGSDHLLQLHPNNLLPTRSNCRKLPHQFKIDCCLD